MTNDRTATDAGADVCTKEDADHRFALGVIAGGVVGLGLGMLLAPRSVLGLRTRAAASARTLADQASGEYRHVREKIGDAVDEVTTKGQGLRDDLADAVISKAEDVERFARDAKTGH